MAKTTARLTLIDGPTLLIEYGGLRFLTDPAFGPPQVYPSPGKSIRKFNTPPIAPDSLLPIDAVLLSHDQHMDNMDEAGRDFLPKAKRVISTKGAAQRIGGSTIGLDPWEATTIPLPNGQNLTITGTPARHGPAGIEPVTGIVTGFVLSIDGQPDIYVTGDTVWFEGIEKVAQRFKSVGLAVLFAGAGQPLGPFHVTMDTNDAIETATHFKNAKIASVHNFGWSHYKQSQEDLKTAFTVVGIDRLVMLQPAVPVDVEL